MIENSFNFKKVLKSTISKCHNNVVPNFRRFSIMCFSFEDFQIRVFLSKILNNVFFFRRFSKTCISFEDFQKRVFLSKIFNTVFFFFRIFYKSVHFFREISIMCFSFELSINLCIFFEEVEFCAFWEVDFR